MMLNAQTSSRAPGPPLLLRQWTEKVRGLSCTSRVTHAFCQVDVIIASDLSLGRA